MPIYEYQCRECGNRFERTQKMLDPTLQVCPQCGGTVKKLISAGAGFLLKGEGFHANDPGDTRSNCGRAAPCCGRETPCYHRPCD